VNDYEAKREARIARMRERAARKRAEGKARVEAADKTAALIPMGQPILIGHHSERRHRRDLERIRSGHTKGFEAIKEAELLERRARAAETSGAISSDDPQAIEKLEAKLASVEAEREQAKERNKQARKSGGAQVPSYRITNLASEARRLRGRIEHLKRRAESAGFEQQIGPVRVVEEDNRVRIIFPDKPSAELRAELKSGGWRWSPSANAWQRHPSGWARSEAVRLAGKWSE
jgi:hypothetical protein